MSSDDAVALADVGNDTPLVKQIEDSLVVVENGDVELSVLG